MITSKTLLALILTTALGFIAGSANAAIINITPSKDNTLYEYDPADGDTSNALGFHFFAGKTAMGELRRGVLAFDIAGSIPAGSTITGVTLSMNMSRAPITVAYPVELHKLLADWGEGTSQASGEMQHGGTASSTRFFGLTKAATFPLQSARASRSVSLGPTRGAHRKWWRMCRIGWITQQATSAGWYWETRSPR